MDLRNTVFLTHEDKNLCRIAELIAFDNGYAWASGSTTHLGYAATAVAINRKGSIVKNYTDSNEKTVIDLEPLKVLFNQPETVELDGKKYLKSDLEEAVKKLKPIN